MRRGVPLLQLNQKSFLGPVLAGFLLACKDGVQVAPLAGDPPVPPTILLPSCSEVGSQVTAAVKGDGQGLTYEWTITHGSLPGRSISIFASKASFTPTSTGPASFKCVAIRSDNLRSRPAEAQVRIHAKLRRGSFSHAGFLLNSHLGSTATLLPTGQVLVAGGRIQTSSSGVSRAELYSPFRKESSFTHGMVWGRVGHAVANLHSGLFLVTGGTDLDGDEGSSEIYDSASGLFTRAATLTHNRSGHTSTFIPSPPGVLIAGGKGRGTSPVPFLELYDPSRGSFSLGPSATLAPGHTATMLPNGKVLLVGHLTENGAWRPWAAVYDHARRTLSCTSGQPGVAREGHQALLLVNPSKVLLLGGNNGKGPCADAEWYDPVSDSFQRCPEPMLVPREDFGLALMSNGEVLIVGGSHDGASASASAERFEPRSQTFAPTENLAQPRRHPSVISLPSGHTLVLGGFNESQGCLQEVEGYSLVPVP